MSKLLSRYVPVIRLGGVIDAKMPISSGLAPISYYEYVSFPLTATSATQTVYTVPNDSCTWKLVAASARFGTASSSGTLQVEVAGAAVAAGSGTVQLTGTVALSGTADTTKNGTLIAAPTTVSAGTAVNAVIAGTMTNLANCSVTLVFQRLT